MRVDASVLEKYEQRFPVRELRANRDSQAAIKNMLDQQMWFNTPKPQLIPEQKLGIDVDESYQLRVSPNGNSLSNLGSELEQRQFLRELGLSPPLETVSLENWLVGELHELSQYSPALQPNLVSFMGLDDQARKDVLAKASTAGPPPAPVPAPAPAPVPNPQPTTAPANSQPTASSVSSVPAAGASSLSPVRQLNFVGVGGGAAPAANLDMNMLRQVFGLNEAATGYLPGQSRQPAIQIFDVSGLSGDGVGEIIEVKASASKKSRGRRSQTQILQAESGDFLAQSASGRQILRDGTPLMQQGAREQLIASITQKAKAALAGDDGASSDDPFPYQASSTMAKKSSNRASAHGNKKRSPRKGAGRGSSVNNFGS